MSENVFTNSIVYYCKHASVKLLIKNLLTFRMAICFNYDDKKSSTKGPSSSGIPILRCEDSISKTFFVNYFSVLLLPSWLKIYVRSEIVNIE